MKCRSEAHETLSLLFHCDGVLPSMIADNSKEQLLGKFKRKLNEANCHLKQTESYSPWMQAAEGYIREIKRGVSWLMIRTGSPKQLWDHCIILQALICSCTTNSIYMTAGQVPDTIIKEEVATLLLLVINHGLTIYEIYGVPSYGLPRGMKRLAVIGPKYPLSLVAQW
jgi:hypothetical protein